MEFKCKKSFNIQDLGYKDDLEVKEGTLWIEDISRWRLAESYIRLLKKNVTREDRVITIELIKERLIDYFEVIK